METCRPDGIARALSSLLTRRGLAGVLGPGVIGLAEPAKAKRKKRRKRRKKKNRKDDNAQPNVTLNAFGCVNTGDFCERADQCCSGLCTGSACQAHDASTCQAGQSDLFCKDGSTEVACTGGGGAAGLCATTTGNAGFCVTDRQCVACKKDADCQSASVCGPGAACVTCVNCVDSGGTACVASGAAGCS